MLSFLNNDGKSCSLTTGLFSTRLQVPDACRVATVLEGKRDGMTAETPTEKKIKYLKLEVQNSELEQFVAEPGGEYEPEPDLLRAWIHLANLPISSKIINSLLLQFDNDPQAIFATSNQTLEDVHSVQARHLVRIRHAAYETQERQIHWFYRNNVKLLTLKSPQYPASLKEISDPPAFLFVRGSLPDANTPAIGIVGSRRATPYGRAVAERFSRELANKGIVIVSGGALGIDTAAHRGAVEAGGDTVAVLGCGLDVDYPKENRELFDRILSEGGALISEYSPGAQPDYWRFPLRNRIISGMTLGTLVVEAPVKSGALITADRVAEQGRVLMTVPANIDRPMSAGSNELLRSGATPVLDIQDILYAVGLISLPAKSDHQGVMALEGDADETTDSGGAKLDKTKPTSAAKARDLSKLTESQRLLLNVLKQTPQHIDFLAGASGMTVGNTGMQLTLLELEGLIKRLPGNAYVRAF